MRNTVVPCLLALLALLGALPVGAQPSGAPKPPAAASTVLSGLPIELQTAAKTTMLLQKWKKGYRGNGSLDDAKRFAEALTVEGRHLRESQVRRLLPVEAHSMEAKMLLIAWDLRGNPERYSEIEQEYLRNAEDPYRHSIESTHLKPQHATEAYRLVWEHTLLRPRIGYVDRYLDRAAEALAKIHNPLSLLTLVEYFREAAEQPIVEQKITFDSIVTQITVLDVLPAFQDLDEGKAALKTCLALAAEQKYRYESEAERSGQPAEPYVWDAARYAQTSAARYARIRALAVP